MALARLILQQSHRVCLGVLFLVDDETTGVNNSKGAAEVPTPIFRMQDRVAERELLRDPFKKRVEGNQTMQEKGKERLGEQQVPQHVFASGKDRGVTAAAAGNGAGEQALACDSSDTNVVPFRPTRDFKAELMQFNFLSDDDFNAQFDAWFEALTAPPPALSSARHLRLVNALEAQKSAVQSTAPKPSSALASVLANTYNTHSDVSVSAAVPTERVEPAPEVLRVIVAESGADLSQASVDVFDMPTHVEWIDETATLSDETGKLTRRVILEWANGARFQGYVSEEDVFWQACSFGVVVWKDGRRYEGEFQEGLPHGEGLLVHPEHGRFEGRFVRGKPLMRKAAQLFTPS